MEIKVYNKSYFDKLSLVNFFRSHLRDFYTEKCLDWQYSYDENSTLYLVFENDEIIATQGFIYYDFAKNNCFLKTSKSESSFLLPTHRGRSIFENVYEFGVEDCRQIKLDMVWGYTALDKVWRDKLKFEVYDNILSESKIMRSSIKAIAKSAFHDRSVVKLVNTISRIISRWSLHSQQFSLNFIDIQKKMDIVLDIQQSWMKNYPEYICFPMGKDALSKRITDNPIARYETIMISNKTSGKHTGYCIINRSNPKEIVIVDLVYVEAKVSDQLIFSLLQIILKKFNDANLSYLGSIKNDYCKQIFESFERLGGRTHNLEDMKFVVKETGEYKIGKISNYTMNGLWTEGFAI